MEQFVVDQILLERYACGGNVAGAEVEKIENFSCQGKKNVSASGQKVEPGRFFPPSPSIGTPSNHW